MDALLEITGVSKAFPSRASGFPGAHRNERSIALDDVNLAVGRQEVVGLVGESGSGKTTLARSVVRLVEPDSGQITFGGVDALAARRTGLRRLRRKAQLIYQDPYQSLNPRLSVGDAVAEPVRVHRLLPAGSSLNERVNSLLDSVGLPPGIRERYPRQLSGGQRQRVAIARALAAEPDMLIADEAVSALDVSVQAQILNLLQKLCAEQGLAMLFISHQLAVVAHLADRVAIMYRGRIVETGPTGAVFETPKHPYTRRLLAAHPLPTDSPRTTSSASIPVVVTAAHDGQRGCRYLPSCPISSEQCQQVEPTLQPIGGSHEVACLETT